MNPLIFFAVALAGGLGASLRFVVDGVITQRMRDRFPLGTLVINVSGSLLLGFITGAAAASLPDLHLHAIFGAGFLGGYTTFSTATTDTIQLIRSRRISAAIVYSIGTLITSVIAASSGYLIGLGIAVY